MEQKQLALYEMNSFNTAVGNTTNCSKCRNKGYIMKVKFEYQRYYTYVVECDCLKDQKERRVANNSGTTQLLEYQFDNFYITHSWQKEIKDLAEENAKSKDWFFIGGQSGAGKTHICSAIANYQRAHKIKVKHIVWTDDINKLKDFEDTSYMQKLKTVECLYIDDMFKRVSIKDNQGLTSADITKTWELLNFRANNKLKTIISTECTLDEIADIDESLAGRIKRQSGKYVLSLSRDKNKNMRLIS